MLDFIHDIINRPIASLTLSVNNSDDDNSQKTSQNRTGRHFNICKDFRHKNENYKLPSRQGAGGRTPGPVKTKLIRENMRQNGRPPALFHSYCAFGGCAESAWTCDGEHE